MKFWLLKYTPNRYLVKIFTFGKVKNAIIIFFFILQHMMPAVYKNKRLLYSMIKLVQPIVYLYNKFWLNQTFKLIFQFSFQTLGCLHITYDGSCIQYIFIWNLNLNKARRTPPLNKNFNIFIIQLAKGLLTKIPVSNKQCPF